MSRKSNHFAGDPIVAAYEQLQEELKGKDDAESAIERKDKEEDQSKDDSDESEKDDKEEDKEEKEND